MNMSNDVVMEFLTLYRAEPILWDPKHPLHRNRSEVSDGWLRIQNAISINCTVSDLKKKKESLMTSFRMHTNKKKRQESYRPTWFAYPVMASFLSGKYECDNSTNQSESEFYGASYSSATELTEDQKYQGDKVMTPRQRPLQQGASKPRSSGAHPAETNNAKKQVDEAVSCLKRATDNNKDCDEYDLYGQLLVKKLRKLDERQRDVAMHEIDNIMFRAKMQTEQPARSYSTSPVPCKVNSPVFISLGHQNGSHYEHTSHTGIQYEDTTDPTQPQS
ncbi:uncharacterized protein LOC105384090 [Plutella xylostella]|uniref:uncharacterized protein LOC105384090 n=1 Tax=Plutella xylostella TaxID=51655 RepID=UPI002032BF68|nr:uncharacterized protein LOC105384090 [Plutella xylostella]